METAVSSTSVISDASRSRMPSRSLRFQLMGSFLLDDDAIHAVVLAEHHGHLLAAARGQVLADVVGTDGQLAMAAVHQDREPDDARTPQVHQRVHGGPDRPTGEEDVVDQHHRAPLDREADLGAADDGLRGLEPQVVAVEGDVERAPRGLGALDGRDLGRDALGEGHPAGLDADQGHALAPAGLLDDLMGDAGEGPVEPGLVEHLGLLARAHEGLGQKKCPSRGGGPHRRFGYRIVRSLPASQGPLKGVIRDVPVLYDAERRLSRRRCASLEVLPAESPMPQKGCYRTTPSARGGIVTRRSQEEYTAAWPA